MNGYKLKDEELIDGLTPGTSEQVPPVALAPTPPMPTKPAPAPAIPPSPAVVDSNPAPMPAPAMSPKLPGMPAGVSDTDIKGYLSGLRGKLGEYGASDMMKMREDLNRRRNSLGYKATEGLKGFADAIMMGVAGAGNPGFKSQFQSDERAYADANLQALKDARATNLQEVQAGIEIDKSDPGSPISKAAQASFGPLFQKLGYQPNSIKGLSAANIESALALMTQYGGKEIEAILRGQEMKLAVQQYEEAKRHNEELESLQAIDDKRAAAEEVLQQSSSLNPFRWKQRAEAKDIISGLAGGAEPANTVDELPPFIKTAINKATGQRIGTRDGKTWIPIK